MNFSISVILIFLNIFLPKVEKESCSDLTVVNIGIPEWKDNSTQVVVVFKNIGNKASSPVEVKLYDLDISKKMARSMKLKGQLKELVEENIGRAKYYQQSKYSTEEEMQYVSEYDYDKDFEIIMELPVIEPGQEFSLVFRLEDYWIYDTNCEIEVMIDAEEKSDDCDRSNNSKWFLAWG